MKIPLTISILMAGGVTLALSVNAQMCACESTPATRAYQACVNDGSDRNNLICGITARRQGIADAESACPIRPAQAAADCINRVMASITSFTDDTGRLLTWREVIETQLNNPNSDITQCYADRQAETLADCEQSNPGGNVCNPIGNCGNNGSRSFNMTNESATRLENPSNPFTNFFNTITQAVANIFHTDAQTMIVVGNSAIPAVQATAAVMAPPPTRAASDLARMIDHIMSRLQTTPVNPSATIQYDNEGNAYTCELNTNTGNGNTGGSGGLCDCRTISQGGWLSPEDSDACYANGCHDTGN